MENRSKAWWDERNHPDFREVEFRRAFKMSKSTFDLICYELDPVVTKNKTTFRSDGPETSPFKDILSAFLVFDEEEKSQEMKENHSQIDGFIPELEQNEQIRGKRARNSTGSVSNVSEVSTQVSGGGGGGGAARRLWVKTRSTAWWDEGNHPDFPEEEFRRAFKMSKATFDLICYELDPVLKNNDMMLRLGIPVRQRVAVCIWRLATGEPLRLVSKRFRLVISTCHKLVLEVCAAIKSVLMTKYLQWPDEEKMKEIKSEFESVSGIQNVGGSMYTTHVPIIVPKVNGPSYLNKRRTERNQTNSHSITVQGVVDSRGIFTDVCIGWPGSMTDAMVLEKSALSHRANRGLLKDVWIVGKSGHPLLDWVLVPYALQDLRSECFFNEKIGEVQRVAKEAFSRLKGRWSCLQKRTEVKPQDLPVVLGACCVLQNICEMRNDVMDRTEIMNFGLADDEVVPENYVRLATVGAIRARDQIAHHLWHHNNAPTGLY